MRIFRPSKEDDYEKILKTAKERGYEFHTVLSFEDVLKEGIEKDKRSLLSTKNVDG